MQKRTLSQKLSFWAERGLLYTLLTTVALLMLFPLIYMVIASLKTTVDFNSNPRRLLPYTHVTEALAGRQEVPVYEFSVNDEEKRYLISQIDANNSDKSDFAYLGEVADLEAKVKLGSHAEQRRNIDVLGIIPIAYRNEEGQKIRIEDQTLTLIPTENIVQLAGNNSIFENFRVYDVFIDGELVQ
ncbi:MAG: hypothetical protein CUN55_10930, partial [Phototrophicales bacterium]